MRSVTVERKSRRSARAQAARKPSRAARETSQVKSGKAKSGASRRAPREQASGVSGFFRRPMLMLGAFVMVLALIGALLASGIVGRGIRAVNHAVGATMASAGFGIAEIHLAGNGRTPPQTILAALGLAPGQSIFAADLGAARARLLALDWIASAEVIRRYPDAIFVNLAEKRPFALWQSPANANGDAPVLVVERDGGIITGKDIEKFARLPKLVGAGAPAAAADLVDIVSGHRAISARLAAYERVSERRWNLIFNDGVVVKLPESGWQKELDALERLIIDKGILERDITEIDLRSPTHYFFVLKSGEKKDVERGKET